MPWNGRRFLRAAIDVDRVIAAFAEEFTAVVFKMSNQITPLHPVASGSRRTSAPRNDSSANSRFACKTISTASFCSSVLEFLGLFSQSLFDRCTFFNSLLRCIFPDVFGYFDEVRLPAKLALRVTLNVIYPAAPAQSRVHRHTHHTF
jgi:hypothetical protein